MIHPILSPGEVALELATLTRERDEARVELARWRDECLRHRRAELYRLLFGGSSPTLPPTVS